MMAMDHFQEKEISPAGSANQSFTQDTSIVGLLDGLLTPAPVVPGLPEGFAETALMLEL